MASRSESGETVFRIVSKEYLPFDGAGAYRFGSRWISPGRWVIHTADSYSLAVLENLVHWQASQLPPNLVFVTAVIPDSLSQEYVSEDDLPKAARGDYSSFREIGDGWYDDGATAVLWVPSLVSPGEWNVIINQKHRDFRKIKVSEPKAPHLDPRIFGPQQRKNVKTPRQDTRKH